MKRFVIIACWAAALLSILCVVALDQERLLFSAILGCCAVAVSLVSLKKE